MLKVLLLCITLAVVAGSATAAGPGPVPAKSSFRVLVVASRAKDHLKMIAAARPFFETMAAANHFDLDFSDDTSLINPVNLAHYQVFVMLHLAPFDMSASQQAALQHFVEEGKGWVGIHAAGLTGKQFRGAGSPYWQWFEDFMGGILYSPHPAFQKATLIVEDRKHPATLHLPARMELPDEWYEFDKSPRDKVRVLASVDESSYHQNKPMGDHPIIWTNQRYRRMIYIGVGHDPVLLADSNYATLLRDAILWAGLNTPPPIPMKHGLVNYEESYTLSAGTPKAELTGKLRQQLMTRHLTIKAATIPAATTPYAGSTSASIDSLTGTGQFKVATQSGHYYWLRFYWTASVSDGQYSLCLTHYYEKPIEPGISNDYSKIEYRWWDFRQGHPWSAGDSSLFAGLNAASLNLMDAICHSLAASPGVASSHIASSHIAVPTRFHVLALYENGGHHLEYSTRAKVWLNQLAADSSFVIDYSTHADTMTEALLANYQLIIQLDYVPYGWKTETMTVFKNYIEQGRGGWIGFHHATLLGEFDGFPMWPWFSDFMGGIRWKDYIGRFAKATVHIEDHRHPVTEGIPDSFAVMKEEWYTYDRSPRPNVHVIANVDESSYQPDTTVKMGDHPVIWTNEKMRARNIYIFMGHSPILFDDPVYKKIFSNAIFWAASAHGSLPAAAMPKSPVAVPKSVAAMKSGDAMMSGDAMKSADANAVASRVTNSATPALLSAPHPFRALAFFSTNVESDHVDFANNAIDFYSALAARSGFTLDTTTNWENCNAGLNNYQVVLWLNDFPHTDQQRAAFQTYMENGGAWLGFHVAGYNDKYTNWPWFVKFFGGAVFYNNNWPPLAAKLIVNDNTHPATHRLPAHYTAPINEWYGWLPNPRLTKDVKVLITLDTANYPLGKKDIIRKGDIPVVWTNTHYRMLYMNMGHGDQNFASPVQDRLFEDAILWLGAGAKR
jgi:type 1 glutamine amidotransferase